MLSVKTAGGQSVVRKTMKVNLICYNCGAESDINISDELEVKFCPICSSDDVAVLEDGAEEDEDLWN